jgi:hypothetical protein
MAEEVIDIMPVEEGDNPPTPDAASLALYREQVTKVLADLQTAMQREGFWVAIASVDAGTLYHPRWHKFQVPPGDHAKIVEVLQETMLDDSPPPPRKPLPRAQIERPKPMDIMFGKKEENETEK